MAGWIWGWVTVQWHRKHAAPWILVSDRPGGSARRREYAQRKRIEATFKDLKSRGWHLESSRLRDADRTERLLLALGFA